MSRAKSPSSAARIDMYLAIAFIAVAIATQIWHPFVLGFYHDDWGLFVQPRLHSQDFHYLGTWHLDRPGYSIFSKLMLEFWDGSTTTFHLIKITIGLLTAAAIAWTIIVYQTAFGSRSLALAASGAAFWLAAPWSLGYSLWPTAAFTNISVLFLCPSAIAVVCWVERNDLVWLATATATLAVSVFFYQSTWLAVFPFVAVIGLREWWNAQPLRRTLVAFLALAAVQSGSIVLTWLYSPKAPNPHVFALFRENMKRVTRLAVEHFGTTGNVCLMTAVALCVVAAVAILWTRGTQSRLRVIAGLLLILTGLAATSAVYASANYGLATSGIFSRTTQMVDFWLAVGGAILFAPALRDAATTKVHAIGLSLSLTLVGACALAYWPAAKPWVRSWELQRTILENSGQLADKLRDGDVVLADVPLQVESVTVFGAPWDITPAVLVHNADRRPDLAYRSPTVQIIPPLDLPLAWKTGEFTVAPGWTLPAKRLLLWRWQAGVVSTVDSPTATRAELLGMLGIPPKPH